MTASVPEVQAMNCPICQTVALESSTVAGGRVESCPRCQGMFLDHGELNRIAEPTPGDLEFATLHDETFRHEDVHGEIECPRCADSPRMRKVEFNIYTGIILDYCPRCEAFWLDGKEIDRINDEVRRLNEESPDDESPPMLWFAQFIWALPR
jgi:Zn-finger nucleic acid-binding protein